MSTGTIRKAYQPSQSDVHVDAVLTQFSVAYIQSAQNYVADRVFPRVPVQNQSDLYWVYDKGDFLRDSMEKRADATESAGSGWEQTTESYYCPVWALHKDIGDQTRANATAPANPDMETTRWLTQQGMIRKERDFVGTAMVASAWATGHSKALAAYDSSSNSDPDNVFWSDGDNSEPIGAVNAAKLVIMEATGLEPRHMVLTLDVFMELMNHPEIIDRTKRRTGDASVRSANEADMAAAFDLDEVLVTRAMFNSATEGADDDFELVASKMALLLYKTPTAGLMMPSAGYNIAWEGYGQGDTATISRMRIPLRKADRIEIEMSWVYKIIARDCGYLFTNVLA